MQEESGTTRQEETTMEHMFDVGTGPVPEGSNVIGSIIPPDLADMIQPISQTNSQLSEISAAREEFKKKALSAKTAEDKENMMKYIKICDNLTDEVKQGNIVDLSVIEQDSQTVVIVSEERDAEFLTDRCDTFDNAPRDEVLDEEDIILETCSEISSDTKSDLLKRFEKFMLTAGQIEEFNKIYDKKLYKVKNPLYQSWLALKASTEEKSLSKESFDDDPVDPVDPVDEVLMNNRPSKECLFTFSLILASFW